ncbi:MAG: hypothetical protein ABSG68_21710 [Thermoguttaceae bacterium]
MLRLCGPPEGAAFYAAAAVGVNADWANWRILVARHRHVPD